MVTNDVYGAINSASLVQEVPVAQVLIRNLPDNVVESYKLKAQLTGTSLEQYLRALIEKSAPLSPAELGAMIDHNMAQFPEPLPSLSTEERREGLM